MKTTPTSQAHRYEERLLQHVSAIIVIADLNFVVQTWNPAAETYYGIAASEAIGRNMGELIQFTFHDTSLEEALRHLQQHKFWQGKVSFCNAAGKVFYFLQTVKYLPDAAGEPAGIMAIGQDMTGQQQAEDRLARSEQFYRALITDSLDVTLLLNQQGEIVFTTPSITRILGFSEEEVLHTNAFQYIHPEDLGWALQAFEREVEENPEIKFIVVRVLKKSGDWLWAMIRGHNLLHNDAINAIAVYIHDDTPRKKATEALHESEKRFRTLIRDMQVGVLLQDRDGLIKMTNPSVCKLFDVTEEEVLGRRVWELLPDTTHEDGRRFLENERPTWKALQTRKLVKDVVMGVWNQKRKERVWIMVNADPLLDDNGNLLQVVTSFTDITERKKLERKSLIEKVAHQRQLAQATIDGQEKERLEIGKELHDNIGQQLTTVKLFLDMAKTTADNKTLDIINMALRGVSGLIDEVRSMSRSLVPPTLKDLGFIDSVNDLIESIRSTQSLSIDLDYYEFDEDRIPENKMLTLYRIIQEQLNNIIKHARAKQVSIFLRLTPGNILLQIKDDGVGFAAETVKKGLGLTNIRNRAELLGGSVLLTTAPGQGCEVNVCLPHSTTLVTTV